MSTAHELEIYDGWAFCADCLAWNHTYSRREEVGRDQLHPDGYATVERCAECDGDHLETEAEEITSVFTRHVERLEKAAAAVMLTAGSLVEAGGLPPRADAALRAISRGGWTAQTCRGCAVVSLERRGGWCFRCTTLGAVEVAS